MLCKVFLHEVFKSSRLFVQMRQNICQTLQRSLSLIEINLLKANELYNEYYDLSIRNPNYFWSELAKQHISWNKLFTVANNSDISVGKNLWFVDGELNVSVNCLDRHVNNYNPAIIWEKDEPNQSEKFSYNEVLKTTCRIANLLIENGIKKGDTVCIYLPTCPLAVCSMLACCRIGAIHCLVFAGFSEKSLSDRINNSNAKLLISSDGMMRGGKFIDLMKIVDMASTKTPSLDKICIWNRYNKLKEDSKYLDFTKELLRQNDECAPVSLKSEDPLFLLYTSGSTGKPKGLIHTQAGYLLHTKISTECVFGARKTNSLIIGSLVDIGWISGHSYIVYGPLSNGLTTVLFESTPNYPNPSRYWQTIDQHKINHLYISPTAIRSLIKAGDKWFQHFDLKSLVTLGSVGEPINEEAWHWYNENIGKKRCPIVDTWWQTETGGIMMSPRPGPPGSIPKPCYTMFPFFGVEPVLLDNDLKEIKENNQHGCLAIKSSVPGMARTILNNHQLYLDNYYNKSPGYYFTGDGAYRDKHNHYHITGRIDDVINVSGHRLSTADIEDVLNHHYLSESAVVGIPHPIKGQCLVAFVVLKNEANDVSHNSIVKELNSIIKTSIGSFAIPDRILIVEALPKTRSGKIVRRVLRLISSGETDVSKMGDLSTLLDQNVIESLIGVLSLSHRTS